MFVASFIKKQLKIDNKSESIFKLNKNSQSYKRTKIKISTQVDTMNAKVKKNSFYPPGPLPTPQEEHKRIRKVVNKGKGEYIGPWSKVGKTPKHVSNIF